MTDAAIFCDPDFARFHDRDKGAHEDLVAIAWLARDARSVLDVGCGKGFLAGLLSPDIQYTGADPATAMPDIARAAPFGCDARSIESDAESLNVGQCFESGHAFPD